MWLWRSLVERIGAGRCVAAVGVCYVALGAARTLHLAATGSAASVALLELVLLAAPGAALVYGGYRLPQSSVAETVRPRVVGWLLGGLVLMLGVVGLLVANLEGSVDRPVWTVAIATALGCLAGVTVGSHEARTISRARQAERRRDELRRERDVRDRIVDTSPIGIAVVDADGSISFANDRAASIVGISPGELTVLRHDESMFSSGDEHEESLLEQVLTTGEPVYGAERTITRGDGQEIWLSVNAAPLSGRNGEVDAVVFTFQDVTERKRLEAENERRIERLRESNDRLQEFARAASHDLQEPLRMVSTYLQLLERRSGDRLDDEAREYLSIAVDSADRMRSMIESLLEFSRVTTEGEPLEETDVGAVLDGVLERMRPRIEATDATITTEELPTVPADADQLALVFRNLLSNALLYSGDEPPEIHVGAERTDVRSSSTRPGSSGEGAESDGGAWEFRVVDEGIGIDPEQQERIFEVFQRLHTDAEYEGTGIGLAVCERIVQRHGGEMDVRSEPGEGATFTFTIPADADRHPQMVP